MSPAGVPTLEQVVLGAKRLPPLRAIVLDVLQNLERPQMHLVDLAEGIGRDVALSADTLRVVNSPFYGLRTPVESIQQAAIILGIGNLRGIVAAAALVNDYAPPRGGPLDAQQFWLHSFACAVWARLLAREGADLAFTAGLLHDVGKIVLALSCTELYGEVVRRAREEARPAHAVEHEILGFDHAAVGAELLAHWRLPERLVRAVAVHHGAPEDGEGALPPLVRTADRIAHRAASGGASEAAPPPDIPGLAESEAQALAAAAQRECAALRALVHGGGAR